MKLHSFLTFCSVAVVIDVWVAGCGSTTRLPPLNPEPEAAAPDTPGTQQQAGVRKRIPISGATAQAVSNEIAGKPLSILSGGKKTGCFTNFANPCSGKYVGLDSKVKTVASTDFCDFNLVNGKVSLTVWDSKETLQYEFLVTAPASYIPPPSKIEDANGSVTLNVSCQL